MLKAFSPTYGWAEHDDCLIFNFLFKCLIYRTDWRGLVPPYSSARQFYSPRPPHTRLHLRTGVGVGRANWLAYNMGMARLLVSAKLLIVMLM